MFQVESESLLYNYINLLAAFIYLAKKDTTLRKCIPVNKQVAVAFGNWRHIQIYGPAIWHWKMCNNALKS